MPESIRNPLNATLMMRGQEQYTLQFHLRAQIYFYIHLPIRGIFLRIIHGFDQFIRFAPVATLIKLAPDTFEPELLENTTRFIGLYNQTALISYDLAHDLRTVSKSYYSD